MPSGVEELIDKHETSPFSVIGKGLESAFQLKSTQL